MRPGKQLISRPQLLHDTELRELEDSFCEGPSKRRIFCSIMSVRETSSELTPLWISRRV